jgi:N-acetylglutamate synthase-like GNAT family acetyltransferase
MIRQATQDDLDTIYKVYRKYYSKEEYVLRLQFAEAIKKNELLYHPESGAFCLYHLRKDGISIITLICIPTEHRRKGIGKELVSRLNLPVLLKCPVEWEANKFYEKLGFKLIEVQKGRKRKLNVWYMPSDKELF